MRPCLFSENQILCILSPPKGYKLPKDKGHNFSFLCPLLCTWHSEYSVHISHWQFLSSRSGNNYEVSLWKLGLWGERKKKTENQENNRLAKGRKTWMKTRSAWVMNRHTVQLTLKYVNSGRSITSNHFLSRFPLSLNHTFCSGIKACKAFIKQHEIHLTLLWML